MAWIETLDESEWLSDGTIRRQVADPRTGQIDNIISVHSIDEGSLKAHLQLYMQAMKSTPTLPKVEREIIAVIVSRENGCQY